MGEREEVRGQKKLGDQRSQRLSEEDKKKRRKTGFLEEQAGGEGGREGEQVRRA